MCVQTGSHTVTNTLARMAIILRRLPPLFVLVPPRPVSMKKKEEDAEVVKEEAKEEEDAMVDWDWDDCGIQTAGLDPPSPAERQTKTKGEKDALNNGPGEGGPSMALSPPDSLTPPLLNHTHTFCFYFVLIFYFFSPSHFPGPALFPGLGESFDSTLWAFPHLIS